MNQVVETKKRVDHFLNAIKLSILRGTSLTSIEMSIKDEVTLNRLRSDIVPVNTLHKLNKPTHAEANEKFLVFKEWVTETKLAINKLVTLPDEDKYLLIKELEDMLEEILHGSITSNPYAALMSYLAIGVTFEGSYISAEARDFLITNGGFDTAKLKESCKIGEVGLTTLSKLGGDQTKSPDGPVVPFPVNYLIYAEMTEVELLGNVDKAPATANSLRVRLASNFQAKLEKGLLSSREEMSLYRILGPERINHKAGVEVNNTVNTTTQQLVVVKNSDKLKPTNLIVGENNELLGVGKSYGNIGKSQLLKLAAGGSTADTMHDVHVDAVDLSSGVINSTLNKVALQPSR